MMKKAITLFLIFFCLFLCGCSHIKNGEIWTINSKNPIEVKGYSDSTYYKEKKEESSPISTKNPIKFVLSLPIFAYQELLSSQDGSTCPFRPSCSHYGVECLKNYYILGIFVGAERFLRCNPYGHHSYNPIVGSEYLDDRLKEGNEDEN